MMLMKKMTRRLKMLCQVSNSVGTRHVLKNFCSKLYFLGDFSVV